MKIITELDITERVLSLLCSITKIFEIPIVANEKSTKINWRAYLVEDGNVQDKKGRVVTIPINQNGKFMY